MTDVYTPAPVFTRRTIDPHFVVILQVETGLKSFLEYRFARRDTLRYHQRLLELGRY